MTDDASVHASVACIDTAPPGRSVRSSQGIAGLALALCFHVTVVLASSEAVGVLLWRTSAVLDGTGNTHVIVLEERGTGDFRSYVLRIDSESISGSYFAADGDKPTIDILAIASTSNRRMIRLKLPGPSHCDYAFYSFVNGRIWSVGSLRSDGCSYAPTFVADAKLLMTSWASFWEKHDLYDLVDGQRRLIRVPQRYYSVGVRAKTKRAVALCENATSCTHPALRVPADTAIQLTVYDSKERAYLLEAPQRIVGWMAEDDITTALDELPWAN